MRQDFRWPLIVVLSIGFLGACGATPQQSQLSGNHYDATVIRHEPIEPSSRMALIRDITQRINQSKLYFSSRGKKQSIKTSANGLEKLPLAVLGALRMTLISSRPGAELDIMVRIKGQKPTPVEIIWDTNGTLSASMGDPTTFPSRGTANLALKFTDGSAKWKNIEKGHVREALSLLSPLELAVIREIPLRREKNKQVGKWTKGGLYEQKGCRALIRMYSSAFSGRHLKFSGKPTDPRSKTISTILHEVAHALHHAPARSAYCKLEGRSKELEARIRRFNAAIKASNGKAQALKLEKQKIEAENAQLNRLAGAANQLSQRGPILEGFSQILKGRQGPTLYGASALEESFAESFALFHADPDALKRIWPEVFTWFSKNQHLLRVP